MKEIESVSLIGLGAVGAVLGTRLQDAMPERFTVIADADRGLKLRREGIDFNGKRYDFSLADGTGVKDLILIATKSTALSEALDAIAPYVGPDTLILSLLNGIDSETAVAERFGSEHVLYSYFLGHPSMREGNHITHDGEYRIFFGEAANRIISDQVQRVCRLFEKADIPYEIPPDMISALWQKFIINIGCNQTTALLRRPYGHLQKNKKAMSLARQMMNEAAAVALRLNIPGAETMVEQAVEVIRSMNPEGKSSMLQDVEAGRPTEIGIFAGTLCRLAEQTDCSVPWNRAALQILSAL